MVALTHTVAFQGVEARPVEVQCALSPGMPGFAIVGLPDKAVSEARERVKAALGEMQIALPSKRVTVNLSPADLPKEGSHFDLPIALSVLAALDIVSQETASNSISLGELSLTGKLTPVTGALPAALTAATMDKTLFCPADCGAEAAWVGAASVFAPKTLGELINHITGRTLLLPAEAGEVPPTDQIRCLSEVRGQDKAKRALEIAAAGRHHLLMVGPPGSGKSMLASRLPGILPPLTPMEALETSQIHSLCGLIDSVGIRRERPFCEPHHTASMPAIVGGGVISRSNCDSSEVVEIRTKRHISNPSRYVNQVRTRAFKAVKNLLRGFEFGTRSAEKQREQKNSADLIGSSGGKLCNDICGTTYMACNCWRHKGAGTRRLSLFARDGIGRHPWSSVITVSCPSCGILIAGHAGPRANAEAFLAVLLEVMACRTESEPVGLLIDIS